MRREELELTNDFKAKQTEIEDLLMDIVSTKLADYADKKAKERYEKIEQTNDKMKELLSKMNDLEGFSNNNLEEYKKYQNIFIDLVNEYQEYFSQNKLFSREIENIMHDEIYDKVYELHGIIMSAELLNCHRTANNLKFRLKKLSGTVEYLLNESVRATLGIYRIAISNFIENICKLEKEKIEFLNKISLESTENSGEESKRNIEKIFDYKRMNKLLEMNGYKEDRQTGDHKIFKNEDGTKSIPVPQRNLGKSLSFSIQKQI